MNLPMIGLIMAIFLTVLGGIGMAGSITHKFSLLYVYASLVFFILVIQVVVYLIVINYGKDGIIKEGLKSIFGRFRGPDRALNKFVDNF